MSEQAVAPSSSQKGSVQISELTVRVNAQRQLRSAKLSINDTERDLTWKKIGKDVFNATFDPSLIISTSDTLTLLLHSSLLQIRASSVLEKEESISIPAHQLIHGHPNEKGQWKWKQSTGKVEVTIHLTSQPSGSAPGSDNITSSNPLVPTTDEIARICPQFRILLTGRSGVGKSSLINGAFGVSDARISHDMAGEADIHTEIFSTQNERFVVHDSNGFEPGEDTNSRTVSSFIETRTKMPQLKDKLHAIWVCVQIPVAGGRVLESGLEDIFRLKEEGHLGKIPIIAVFTKLDELVPREMKKLFLAKGDKLTPEQIQKAARKNAEMAFRDDCLNIFQEIVGAGIPYKAVSTEPGYESTLLELIQITFDNVNEHVAKEASIVTTIAENVSSSVKIEGPIEVGKTVT